MRHIVLTGCVAMAACTAQSPSTPVAHPSPPPPTYPSPEPAPVPQFPAEPTRILSQTDADRLLGNSGITLQWIGWDERGKVAIVPDERGVWRMAGAQRGRGNASLKVEGVIEEIGDGYFTLDGIISIQNTPDAGRDCRDDKTWHFAITQNRRYYRLREFEWCDGLTDYVDIYF